jgi:hypothetical protein
MTRRKFDTPLRASGNIFQNIYNISSLFPWKKFQSSIVDNGRDYVFDITQQGGSH